MALEAWDGRSLTQGVAHLLAARERRVREATGPWSIAELELLDADFEKLLSWARQQDGPSIKRRCESTDLLPLPEPCAHVLLPGEVVVGLLLLALCAECTARLGSTYAPWAASADALGDCPLRRALFSEGGQALPPLKNALLSAAQRCWMRSGDLRDDTRNRWYRLLLHQGGIPRRDVALLPRWLSNPDGRSFLVGALLEEVPSFRAAWDALEQLRCRAISRDRAAQAVAACPFFRKPHEPILDAAVQSLAVGSAVGDPEVGLSALSASVRVEWARGACEPTFVICPSFVDKEFGGRVVLSVDGAPMATYRRGSNGILTRFGGGALTVPAAAHWVLTAESGADVEVAEVDLFESDEAIACFDGSGAPCAADAQAVRCVITREPIVTRPERPVVWLEAQGLGVAAVEPGTEVETSEGLRVWPSAASAQPGDAGALLLRATEWQAGDEVGSLTVRLAHAPAVRVKAARVGSSLMRIEARASADACDNGCTVVQGLVPASSAAPEIRLTVTASVGGRLFQQTLRSRAFTAASIDGAWIDAASTIEAAGLRAGKLRVSLGSEYTGYDARLVAPGGSTKVVVDARRPPRLVHTLGYGEPLVLCSQEPWRAGPRHLVAASIEDHGHVVGHRLRDGHLVITHRLHLGESEEYWLLVWPRRGEPITLLLGTPGQTPADDAITVPYDPNLGEPRAVALCYGTAVLGASWAADWSHDLERSAVDTMTLVKLIRLLSLPVLAAMHLGIVSERLRQLGVSESMDALAGSLGTGGSLNVGNDAAAKSLGGVPDVDRWRHVARALLVELRLTTTRQLDALKKLTRGRSPSLDLPPGRPATPEQLKQLREQRATQSDPFGAYLGLLLRAGAVHPRDAVRITPDWGHQRGRLANNLADASMGLNAEALEKETPKKRRSLRNAKLAARRQELGVVNESVAAALSAARAWAETSTAPDEALHAALVDQRLHSLIQLELLDELRPR